MPLPFLLAGAALLSVGLGATGHSMAKETNEEAEEKIIEAQELYDSSKKNLEEAQETTKEALYTLGYAKKDVLEGTLHRFWNVYKRFQKFKVNQSKGLNELSKFSMSSQERRELEELSSVYATAISTGAATTGALMAFAATGAIPTIGTGAMLTTIGGGALATGGIGAGILVSSVITPLAFVAPPAIFVSGIAASMKADENLEKAKKALAEAKEASEKMKTSQMLCEAITKRTNMFYELLISLEIVLENFTYKMEDLLDELEGGGYNTIKIDEDDLTDREVEMVMVAASLAHSVKQIIDTPILTEKGDLSSESLTVYSKAKNKLEKSYDVI